MSKNDVVFEPFPLSPEAVYELLHFTHWGVNLLRTRIHGLKPAKLPAMMPMVCVETGEVRMLPTGRHYKDSVVAAIKEMMEQKP